MDGTERFTCHAVNIQYRSKVKSYNKRRRKRKRREGGNVNKDNDIGFLLVLLLFDGRI